MLEKKRILFFVFVIIIILLGLNYASASIGISPTIYDVEFKPRLKQTFEFKLFGDKGTPYKLYVDGDLAEYAKVEPELLTEPDVFKATIKLPKKIKTPGDHIIYVGIEQQYQGETGFALLGNVKGAIRIRVPYPDKYILMYLNVESAKSGDPVIIKLMLTNLGLEPAIADSVIEIYDDNENKVDSLVLGSSFIDSKESKEYKLEWDTDNREPGRYKALAITNYGDKTVREEKDFRIGEYFIDIISTSDNFLRDRINKFDIEIESLWNDPIENVYADVEIIDHGIKFKTPSVDMGSFGTSNLTGYFDTSTIGEEVESFNARIQVNYGTKTTEKIVKLRFKKAIDYVLLGLIIAVVFVILIFMIMLILYRRAKKDAKEKRAGKR